jgi:hypothetical protein
MSDATPGLTLLIRLWRWRRVAFANLVLDNSMSRFGKCVIVLATALTAG